MTGCCIVVGAGEFVPLDMGRKEGDLCIAVDGGYEYCRKTGMEPDLIIGDMDSLEENTLKRLQEETDYRSGRMLKLNPEKDDTDMMAALRIGLEKGYKTFRLYGATGGRIEHTIANIQCMVFLKNNGATAYMIDTNVTMNVIRNESVRYDCSMKGYLSMFALGERAVGVTITGMKYPLYRAVVTNDFPIGISNEFIGEEGCVSVENGMLLLITAWK